MFCVMLWVYGFSLGFSLGCICICPLMHFGYMILVIKRETGHLILQGWYKLHTYVFLPHFAVILSTMFLQIITEEGNEFAVDVLESRMRMTKTSDLVEKSCQCRPTLFCYPRFRACVPPLDRQQTTRHYQNLHLRGQPQTRGTCVGGILWASGNVGSVWETYIFS